MDALDELDRNGTPADLSALDHVLGAVFPGYKENSTLNAFVDSEFEPPKPTPKPTKTTKSGTNNPGGGDEHKPSPPSNKIDKAKNPTQNYDGGDNGGGGGGGAIDYESARDWIAQRLSQ